MTQAFLTVEDVANRLDLHTRTIHRYIREGRLKAARIGKSYRITEADLRELTGEPAVQVPTTSGAVHASASCIIELENIGKDDAIRITNGLVAAAGGQRQGDPSFRVDTIYDTERARLKVICLGGLRASQAILGLIDVYIGGQS